MFWRLRGAVLLAAGWFALAGGAQQTIEVGPGQAYTTIQAGINAAVDNDTVMVEPGIYYENIDFLGKDITVRSSGGAAVTILDGSKGQAPGVTLAPENAKHLANTPPPVLNGFTIQNGGVEPSANGPTGGIYIYQIAPTISNNVITHNHCYGISAVLTVEAPLIENNEIDNTLDNNGQGGGDCPAGGGSAINIAPTGSGCVDCVYQPTVVLGDVIENNVQGGQEGPGGGGITAQARPVTVENSTIRNNATARNGGAIYLETATGVGSSVVQNLIYGNQAGCGGGAIASQRNVGYAGPNTDVVLIASNTMVDNTASAAGCSAANTANAGQMFFGDTGSNIYSTLVLNNIVTGSTAGPMVACALKGAAASAGTTPIFDHNDFLNTGGAGFDASCTDPTRSYGNIAADPQFQNAAAFEFQPASAASPVVDAGNTSAVVMETYTPYDVTVTGKDFAGSPRVADGSGKGYSVIDMGAYELAGAASPQTTTLRLLPLGQTGYASVFTASGGSTVNLAATVASPVGGGTGCSGPVAFVEDGATLGSDAIQAYAGTAEQQNVFLAPGVHRFTATYAGVSPCSPGTAVEILYVVSNYAPQLTLTSSVDPVLVGQPVTFTVTIKSADPAQGGPIVLTDGGTVLATLTPGAAVAGTGPAAGTYTATATFTDSALTLGTHNLVASYAGDAAHNAASAGLTEYVVAGPIATATAVISSENPSAVGDMVTLYASVTSASGPPTGTVVFADNGTPLGPAETLSYGNAQFSTNALTLGAHNVSVTYTATGLYTNSAGSVTQNVESPSATTLAVTAAGVPATSVPAQTVVTLTATVTSGGAAVAPGQVQFCDATAAYCTGAHLIGAGQLTASGSAIFKFVPGPGTHSYEAVFVGTNSYAGSTSVAVPLVVLSGASVSAVGIQASGGQGDYTLLGTVAPAGMVSPSGQVSFLDTTNANYQLGAAALTPTGASNTSFLQTYSYQFPLGAGVRPGYVATGDFNNDGHQDVLFASGNLGAVYTLLGNGDGTFTSLHFSAAVEPVEAPLVADFNSDGKLDFVVRTKTGLAVFLGNGDGTFTAGFTVSISPLATFAVADLNNDGVPDLLVASGGSLYAYLGDGSGGFAAPKLAFQGTSDVLFALTADFNGDGNINVLLASSSGVLRALLGNGDGTFRSGPVNPALGFGVSAGAVGDLNGDGKPDVVISEELASYPPIVLLGNGDGSFTVLPRDSHFISASNAVTLADFNGDGILDAVFPDLYGGDTNVYVGKGDGTFTPDIYSPGLAYFTSESLATADFNGDGQADIAEVFNGDFNQLVVLLSQSASTAAGYANNISPVGTGYHNVEAFYPGDANNPAGTSQTIPLLAQQVTTALTLTANPASSAVGQTVTLTASLDQFFAQNHSASGTATFTSNGNPLGTAQITDGTASLTTSALTAGADSLQAEYAGDVNFTASASSVVPYKVSAPQPQTITFPQPPAPAFAGTSVLLTATASSGLPVTYTVISGPAYISTLNGAVLTYTGAGTVVVEADQAGNGSFTAAPPVQMPVTTTVLTEPVGAASPAVSTAVVFSAPGTLGSVSVLTQGAAGRDFNSAAGSTCAVGAAYSVGQSCVVNFTFTPTLPGARFGGITLATSGGAVLANTLPFGSANGPLVNWTPGTLRTLVSGIFRPIGLAVDGSGNLFYGAEYTGALMELKAGSSTPFVLNSSLGATAGIAVDGSGNLFVSDFDRNTVSELLASGGYATLVPLGSGWYVPGGLAVDANGNLFVADTANNRVVELTASSGDAQMLTLPITIHNPEGLAVDGKGDLFLTNATGIFEATAASGYSTVVTLETGIINAGVATDSKDNLYVADGNSKTVVEWTAASGYTNQIVVISAPTSGISAFVSVAVDGSGNVYADNFSAGNVYELDVETPPSLTFASTAVGATSSDSPQTVTITNNGNAGLDFLPPGGAPPGEATNPSITAGFTFTSSCPVLAAGTTAAYSVAASGECAYAVSFMPVSAGQNAGKLVLTDDNLNVAGATQTVLLNGLGTGTTTGMLVASPEPSPYGASFTLTATFARPVSGLVPTGTVTFSIDGAPVGSAPVAVVNGIATATYTVPAYSYSVAAPGYLPGVHTLAAVYSGDANYGAVAVTPGSHTVTALASDANLTNLVTPIFYGQEIGFTNGVNAVASSGVAAVGGSIYVSVDGVRVCTLDATVGMQQCPDPPFEGYQVGVHEVVVGFSGDAIYAASTSAAQAVQIVPDPTATAVSSSPNPSTFGENVTLTATTTSTAGFTDRPLPVPTGPVMFYDGGTAIGTAPLNAQGVASLAIATLSVGTHDITASYAATLDFNASSSATTAQQVNPAPGAGFMMTVTPAAFSTYIGVGFAATVTIAETGGYSQPVQLSCGGLPRETTCAFGNATIAAGGGVTRLVITPAAPRPCNSSEPYGATLLPLFGVLTLAFFARRRRLLQGLLLAAVLCLLPVLNGCGGNCTDLGTKPGSYTFRVTGTATGSTPQSQTQGMKMTVTS